MTAVEWLVNRIAEVSVMEKDRYYIPYNNGTIDITELVEQAKAMEKEHIEISDEEIANKAEEFELTNGIYGFKHGVKWYREQLKKKI